MQILFQNDEFLVINKPAGVMVHHSPHSLEEGTEKTVADFVMEEFPEMKEVGESWKTEYKGQVVKIYRPGIVHRLDKDTSGVMVIAKTQVAFEYLKEQFKNRQVEKVYNAIVWGSLKEKEGVIDESIGRSPSDFRKWSANPGKRGVLREAVTEYTVLEEFEREGFAFSLLELRPKTGRTHQIRVHLQYLQRPIVCDSLYAGKKPCPFVGRLALHARTLSFVGSDGQKYSFEAPLPEDMASALVQP